MTMAAWPLIAQDLVLSVSAPAKPVHVGDHSSFAVTVSNRGPKSVTLVEPGDGSDCKLRTPVVGWSILPADAKAKRHPKEPPPFRGPRMCGNINPLKLSEVFTLQPGESRRLGAWTGDPDFAQPGRYRVVFYYQNIPKLPTGGLPLGPHDDGVVGQIRKSTRCRLVSTELVVDVLPAHDTAKILAIAREAVAKKETWASQAQFSTPTREPDGAWKVRAWRVPDKPGDNLLLIIDAQGRVTHYSRQW